MLSILVGAAAIVACFFLLVAASYAILPKQELFGKGERAFIGLEFLGVLLLVLVICYLVGEGVRFWLSKLAS